MFPELSLTSHNLSTVLNSMDDDKWENFSHCVNIPGSVQERIWSQYSSAKECKQAAIDYLISSHPAPSWRLVSRALYRIATYGTRKSDSSHRALADLQRLFPTGIYMYVSTYKYIYIYVGESIYMYSVAGFHQCCGFESCLTEILIELCYFVCGDTRSRCRCSCIMYMLL